MTTDTHRVGRYLLRETVNRARGQDKPYAVGDEPSDLFYIANLSPEAGQDDRDEFDAKTKPSTIGLQCQPAESSSDIAVEFDLYVPSLPTYEEFTEIQDKRIRGGQISAVDQLDDVNDWEDVPLSEIDRSGLYRLDEAFYRSLTISYTTKINLTKLKAEQERITAELQSMVSNTVHEFAAEHRIATEHVGRHLSDDHNFTALPQDTFETARDAVSDLSVTELQWDLRLAIERPADGEITLRLENRPPAADPESLPGEQFIFNPVIRFTGSLNPYTFDLLPSDYRYDQNIWAKGHNCSTTTESESDPHTVRTAVLPTSPVYEFVFNSDYETDFAQLSTGDTVETLEAIASGMWNYYEKWIGPRQAAVAEELELSTAEIDEYEAAAERFKAEIERFEHGVEILRSEPDVLRAFRLMNEVNDRQHEFDGWRLFQLVFIVSNLSGIITREYGQYQTEYDDRADVLWFPTGGGKTEAYVGLVLFNLFFDRLRGKTQGVTAWIRFPLRLLSRQQKTRFLTSLLYAEEIRRDDGRGLDGAGEPFSLGFFAGSHDTPNAIGTDRDPYREMFQENHEKLAQNCQVVEKCPLCDSEVTVEYDPKTNRVSHVCQGANCLGELPLYVVDRDIYRYVPSVLLGSLDKIAVMGMQPRFANLFGNLTTECPVHGYGYSGKCSEHHICEHEDDIQQVNHDSVYDPIPTLHLIDEVHLLNEELGTFASHYETLYATLCEKIGGETPKVLASTATIAEYDRQIENLFQQGATRFPADGPVQGETFYGELTETVEREYLGFKPRNRSHLYAVLDTIIDYHQVIRDAYAMDPAALGEAAGVDSMTADEQAEILDLYETSLVYFNAKDRKDRYRENITKYANNEMVADGYATPLRERQLTADTESPELLEELEEPGKTPFDERIDTVPATSFIGHGIDVDRFNMMLFYGYPRQTFQYIQASSRVGRQSGVVGFVLDVFDPLNERDDHRYRYFEKIHEYLDRTVEPVPIDRWAKFGIERTFTGILQACLIQYYRPLMYRSYEIAIDDEPAEPVNVQKANHLHAVMTDDSAYPELTQGTLQEMIETAYSLDNEYYTNPYFRSEVTRKTTKVWNFWERKLPEMNYPEFPDGEEPMISLRDIGEQGSITPDYNDQPFMKHLTGEGD